MRYGSVCSGIEAATVAWHPLGWEPAWFAEIEPFPSVVLAHHYPSVLNLGDMTTIAARIRAGEVEAPDLLVGGTPCQSFSVAGLRGGLSDARGNLALAFVELADAIDAVRRDHGKAPAWILWENVPGVFTADGGGAFGSILGGLVGSDAALSPGPAGWTNAGVVAGPDRVAAWRVLDAQHFGVAQRRRRVFVLARGGARAWDAADALLPLIEGVRWNPPPRRAAGARAAGGAEARAGERGSLPGWAEEGGATAQALTAHPGGRYDLDTETFVPALTTRPYADTAAREGALVPALTASIAKSRASSNDGAMLVPEVSVQHGMQVRRLTPVECERLQGFPDVKETVILTVWRSEDERRAAVSSVEQGSQRLAPEASAPVLGDVLIDCERQAVRLLSRGKLLWSASDAGESGSSPLRMPRAAFVHLAALMTRTAVTATRTGAGASPANMPSSSLPLDGSAHVSVCGAEIAALAGDAARLTDTATRCTRFITSGAGPSFLGFDSTLRTLCCCVAAAIGSCIPAPTSGASSFVLRVETLTPYTLIPGAKDGPRYRALGNSMAVPVMLWIGRRIALVDAAVDVRPRCRRAQEART